MNALKNMSNVVIGQLDKLAHKQNCFHDLFYFINYNIILVHDVRYITTETKKLPVSDITGFFFRIYTQAEKETRYIQYGRFFWFNSTVSYTCSIPYITTHIPKVSLNNHNL
jgi:hypothetical protein